MSEERRTQIDRIDQALGRVRESVDRGLGVDRPPGRDLDPADLVRFSPDLATELSAEQRRSLAADAERLGPWLQGPFLLGGDLVVGASSGSDRRWIALAEEVPTDLSGRRVLDVGSGAGYDAFMFKLRGADHVLACEPSKSHEQALFLESIYGAGIDFRNIGWRGLSTTLDGRFELVHCNGVHRALHPMRLLERLREMLAPGGTVLLGSALLADPELSEYARFVPTSFHGDRTWWWVPGRLTFRWWLEAAGLAVEREFGRLPGPSGGFRVETGYLRASAAEALREEVPTGE